MDILRGGDLRAGNKADAVFLCGGKGSRTVFAGIVVGQGDDIQSVEQGKTDQISRRHAVVPAGGETGMDVQIRADHNPAPTPAAVS